MSNSNVKEMLRIRPIIWISALVLGVLTGFATIAFRIAIERLERFFYGEDSRSLASHAANLDWWILISIPTVGGLIVGLILHRFTPDGRGRTVGHVI